METEIVKEPEMADRAKIGERTLQELRYRGLIPYLPVGKRGVRYMVGSVMAALEKMQIQKRESHGE
jgi:hypothetical protein